MPSAGNRQAGATNLILTRWVSFENFVVIPNFGTFDKILLK